MNKYSELQPKLSKNLELLKSYNDSSIAMRSEYLSLYTEYINKNTVRRSNRTSRSNKKNNVLTTSGSSKVLFTFPMVEGATVCLL